VIDVLFEDKSSRVKIAILGLKDLAQKASTDLGGSFVEILFMLKDFK
jgi:hypothetical protein